MPSGPVEEVFLVLRIAVSVMCGVKGGSELCGVCSLCKCLSIALSWCLCGSLLMLE